MTLPCIVCGTKLESALPNGEYNQPYSGTTFSSHGQYGSTVWDPMSQGGNETLEINVCDHCLLKNPSSVLQVTRTTTTSYYERQWNPESAADYEESR